MVRNPVLQGVEQRRPAATATPTRSTYDFGLTDEAEVTAVENGQADWMFDPPPADRLAEIGTKYADQVHVNTADRDVVRADEHQPRAVQQREGAPGGQLRHRPQRAGQALRRQCSPQPVCQILPPGFPGHVDYCPYTKDPGTELDRARPGQGQGSW